MADKAGEHFTSAVTGAESENNMDFQLFRQRFQLHIHTAIAGLAACFLISYQLSTAIHGNDPAIQTAVKYLNISNNYVQKWWFLCLVFFIILATAAFQYSVQFKSEKGNSYKLMHAFSIIYIIAFVFLIGIMIFLTSGFSSPFLAIYAMMFALLMENGNFDKNGRRGSWLRFWIFALYMLVLWVADNQFHHHFDPTSQKYIKDNIVSGWIIHMSMATASLAVPFISNWVTSFFAHENDKSPLSTAPAKHGAS